FPCSEGSARGGSGNDRDGRRAPQQVTARDSLSFKRRKRRRQLLWRLKAVFSPLGEQFRYNRRDGRRDLPPQRLQTCRPLGPTLVPFVQDRPAGKARPTRQQEEERAAKAVEVGTNVGVMRVLGLLGAHVIRRAHEVAIVGQTAVRLPRGGEVQASH